MSCGEQCLETVSCSLVEPGGGFERADEGMGAPI